jgi:hypothetical protein
MELIHAGSALAQSQGRIEYPAGHERPYPVGYTMYRTATPVASPNKMAHP